MELTIHLAFEIASATCRPDGTMSPFSISSIVSLSELRNIVAEKLQHYPGHVLLQHRLDSDKARSAAMSVQTDEELQIFKARMRSLFVPQHLPSGKISTRPLKKCYVIFEDGSMESDSTGKSANKTSVCAECIYVHDLE